MNGSVYHGRSAGPNNQTAHWYQYECECGWESGVCRTADRARELGDKHDAAAHEPVAS